MGHEDYQTKPTGNTTLTVVLCLLIVIGLAVIISPAFMTTRHHPGQSDCQSNLKQIGVSIKTYLSDWDGYYPTNRQLTAKGKLGLVHNSVRLSRVAVDKTTGKPVRFQYGVNWVEGLYQYIEPVTTLDDDSSVWKCHFADAYPPTSNSAAVSYVFNRNLVEKSEDVVRSAGTLMMVRESDRLVDSDLRPTNDSVKKNQPPASVFLTDQDQLLGRTNPNLHGTGSHILFADGHVKLFNSADMGNSCYWDANTNSWANKDNAGSLSKATIYVSP